MRIVLGFDGSPAGEAAAEWVATHSAALDPDVTAVTVVPRVELWQFAALQIDSEQRVQAQPRLLEGVWTSRLRTAGCRVSTRLLRGDPAGELCEISEAMHADPLVIGAKSHSAVRSLLGGTAHKVANHSRAPLDLVPSPVAPAPQAAPKTDANPVPMLRPFL
jgi:nucleotide-binding universal stress UspA family protein